MRRNWSPFIVTNLLNFKYGQVNVGIVGVHSNHQFGAARKACVDWKWALLTSQFNFIPVYYCFTLIVSCGKINVLHPLTSYPCCCCWQTSIPFVRLSLATFASNWAVDHSACLSSPRLICRLSRWRILRQHMPSDTPIRTTVSRKNLRYDNKKRT